MTSKLFFATRKMVAPLFLCALGLIFFMTPQNPGHFSNIVAWLETEAGGISQCIGIFIFLCGILSLTFIFRSLYRQLYFTRGKLTCLIETGVIQSIVEQIIFDFFEKKDLHVLVSIRKNALYIHAEIPEDAQNIDEFIEYLKDQLFKIVGYYGEIQLSVRHP